MVTVSPQISVSADIEADISQGWSGFTIEICSSDGTCELHPRQPNLDLYSHWRVEGQVLGKVSRGGATSHPAPTPKSEEWYVCEESPDPFVPARVPTITLKYGTETRADVPSDCQKRGSHTTFAPSISDSGKYLAVAVTHANSVFETIVFHRSSKQIELAPRILPERDATAPQISGPAELGQTLLYEAKYAGFPEPEADIQWYRCKRDFPELWTHSVPLDNVAPSVLVERRKNRIIPGDFFMNYGCSEIPGQVTNEYTLTDEDRGLWVTVFDTAKNDVGSYSLWAASTSRVEHVPYLIERTNSAGEPITPRLECQINFMVNTTCTQPSNYTKGTSTFLRTMLPASTEQFANSWRFLGRPEAEISQQWYVCKSDVPRYTETIPADCVQVEPRANDEGIYDVRSRDWGSWVVTTYTAANRLGTLTLVAASRYLRGEPYSLEPDSGDSESSVPFTVTGATIIPGEGVADTTFVINYSGDTPAEIPSELTVEGIVVELLEVVEPDASGDGSVTWLTSDRSVFADSADDLSGWFNWDGRIVEVEFSAWSSPSSPPASLDDIADYPSGLGMRGSAEETSVVSRVFSQGNVLFAPGSVVRFYSYPGATLVAKEVADLDGRVQADIDFDRSADAIVAVGVGDDGNELVRSASVQTALNGVFLSYRVEDSSTEPQIIISWEDLDSSSPFSYEFSICHPLDELVGGGVARPEDCLDGDGFLVDVADDDLSSWVKTSTEVAFTANDFPWYGDSEWSWVVFAVSVYEDGQLISGLITDRNWLSFSSEELRELMLQG